jgi:hypothetical protein
VTLNLYRAAAELRMAATASREERPLLCSGGE